MRILRVGVLIAFAATTASAQGDGSARSEGGALDSYKLIVGPHQASLSPIPRIAVFFERPVEGVTVGFTFALEWTANGVPQPRDLWDAGARCVGDNSQVWCTALLGWFKASTSRSRPVSPNEFPQGFVVNDLEYDTRYCFRVLATVLGIKTESDPGWSRWTCSRTPAAPPPLPLPPRPSNLSVVVLPASDGRGVPGGALPARALLEWDMPDDLSSFDIKGYFIQRARLSPEEPQWESLTGIAIPVGARETTVDFAADAEITDESRILFRVCALNVTGRACSAGKATSPIVVGPVAPKRDNTANIPEQTTEGASTRATEGTPRRVPPAATPQSEPLKPQGRVVVPGRAPLKLPICESARIARARNSPAAPGLEAQCAAALAKETVDGASAGTASAATRPMNVIDVRVRYRKELGYKGTGGAFGSLGPTSCNAFIVSAVFSNGARQRDPISVSTDWKMDTLGEYYVCNYRVSDVPLAQAINVTVFVAGQDQYARWEGSSMAQPPSGQRREISDPSRTAELNSAQPRARFDFEMTYVGVTVR